MRDLDIRGAGDLLGDEQSGHVAAVGFELYCQMIDEAVAEAARAGGGAEGAPEPVRLDVAGRRLPAGRLHPLRGGEDRRPPPHRAAPASRASCARSATSSATASGRRRSRSRTCWRCSGRGSSSASPAPAAWSSAAARIVAEPLELDSERVGRLRERIPEAIFSSRDGSLTLRAPGADAPDAERIERLDALADAISASREAVGEAA